jgi:hypothetical protein
MKQKTTKNERTTALWAKIHVRLLLALLVGLLTGTGTAWAEGTTNANLLTNGDCANNTFDGWTCSPTGNDYLHATDGYWQSSYNEVSMTQTVNLTAKGFTDTKILDNGSLTLIASGDLATPGDGARKAIIKVECLDNNGAVVSGDGATTYLINITEQTYVGFHTWKTYEQTQTLPTGTRQIRYSVIMQDYNYNLSGFYGPKFDNAVIMLLTSEQNVSHNITLDTPTHGTLTMTNNTSLPYKPVSVGYTSDTGYYMSACNMSYIDDKGTAQTKALTYDKMQAVGAATFIMPTADVSISATFTPIPTVTVESTGTNITAPANAIPGSTVTLSVNPDAGNIGSVSYTPTGDTKKSLASDLWYPQTLTFTMPASNVTVNGSFTSITNQTDLTVNIPKRGTLPVNIPAAYKSLKIYDDGGATANYSDNCDGYLELTAPADKVINLRGTLNTAQSYDYLYFYDGTSAANYTKFESPTNNETITMNVTTTGNSAKLNFQSAGGLNYSGIYLDVKIYGESDKHSVILSEEDKNAGITALVQSAYPATVVTLNVTPKAGTIGSVSYTYGSNTTILATDVWYPQTLTFKMPEGADVTIHGNFSQITNQTNLTVNIPKTGTLPVNIPAAYKSLKIYDDGGATANYSDNCDGYLELTAPADKVINLRGTLNTENNYATRDVLFFYDGISATNSTFLTSPSDNTALDIDVTTTVNNAKLRFYSGDNTNRSGINLDVKLYSESDKCSVTLSEEAKKAGITASATSAYPATVVTLNVTPKAGTIVNVSYTPAGGTETTAFGIWYPQTLTFTMPESKVTVNGSFSQITNQTDLTVNIPKTGTISASIPAAYHSLKIYDDGGASGNYSDKCFGFLELTAPAGNVINLKGTLNTETFDILSFFDGISAKNHTEYKGTDVGMDVTTTVNSAKLRFFSDDVTNYSGIDLDVVLKQNIITATPDATMTIDGNTAPGYWATLYTVVPRTIPEGVTAYYIQDGTANDAYAKLVKLTGTVLPAGNGYLLNYNASAELSFAYTETAATDVVTGNLLKGGAVETTDDQSGYLYYILGRTGTSPDYTYGFYWQSSDKSGVTDGTKVVSAANKAYLKVPHTTGGAKSMALTFGDGTTGISNTAVSAQENGAWYTLQGVCLTAEPTQRGIYIHNKKKVIIK